MGIIQSIFKKKDTKIRSDMTITNNKNINLSPKESLSRKPYSEKKPKPSMDEQWQNISKQSQQHLQEGKIGLYACDLYSLSEIDRKEKRYNDQMKKLMISAYIHLSGTDEFAKYQFLMKSGTKDKMLCPLLPPAVIKSTTIAMKRLNMDIASYQERFRQTIKPTMTPIHIYGLEGALEIICLYLNDKSEKAEKEIRNGVKKYIANHS